MKANGCLSRGTAGSPRFFRSASVLILLSLLLALLPGVPARAASKLTCSAGAITCIELAPEAGRQPVTFGQVFKLGNVPAHSHLSARDRGGNPLPLQMDQPSTYPDGSLRFAILSTIVPAAGGAAQVNLFRDAAEPSGPPPGTVPPQPNVSLAIDVTTHSFQTTIVKFGNRDGHTPGIPFKAGEIVSLTIAGESYSLNIGNGMTSGDFTAYQAIAQAFAKLITSKNAKVRASWNGAEAGFEEDLWLEAKSDDPFSVSINYQGPAKIAVIAYQTPAPPEKWTATLGSETGPMWLNGPVAVERDIAIPLRSARTGKPHPLLAIHVHLRRYVLAGADRADIVFENDWSYAPAPRNLAYDVAIRRDGKTVYGRQHLDHTHHARWHMVLWSGGLKDPVVRYDAPYFVSSGLVPHYDSGITVSRGALADAAKALEQVDRAPFGTGTLTLYMPTTGMRADIGPLPEWTAQYLLSMDPNLRALMLINADAGAAMPIHYRDEATGLPVSLDRHPGLAMVFGRPSPADAFPPVQVRTNPWTVDVAHLPSLSYVPYLVTGDLFYLEEVMSWANWVMGGVDPGLRGMQKGLLWGNQVRATAWGIRTLGEAAIILPDAHPMKKYFNEKLQNNLAYYLQHFAHNKAANVSPLGILENVDQNGQIGPWQYDFLFLSIADLARAGIPHADELLRWMAGFVVGRWSAEAQGYCYRMAPAYYVKFRDASGQPFRDWGALFRFNWPDVKSCPRDFPSDSGPDTPVGYVANAYAALGAAASLSIPGASEARQRIVHDSPAMLRKFADDPTFAIVP